MFAWALRADFDPATLKSNTFSMEWPPKSGNRREFPEIDQAGWFGLDAARLKILNGQAPFLDELQVKHNSLSMAYGLNTL